MDKRYPSLNRRHNQRFFYKYVTASVAKIVIATRKLRWSSPLLFNDPFDITQELRLNFDEHELASALTNRVADLLEQGNHAGLVQHPLLALLIDRAGRADATTRANMAQEMRAIGHKATQGQIDALAMLRDKWKELVPNFRVLCFSEINDVTPMWHHYADGYRGVVLEFSAEDVVDSAFLVARPIVYQDDPPAIADVNAWVDCLLIGKNAIHEKLLIESQYVKTAAWAYEKEWRIASTKRPGEAGLYSDYGYHPQELNGVYFGLKCDPEDCKGIVSLLVDGFDHVRIYEAISDLRTAKFIFRSVDR